MTEILWRGQSLQLNPTELEAIKWVPLNALVTAVDGYLQPLPGNAIGLCLADDLCLPLGAEDVREHGAEQFVRLTALTPLGITTTDASPVEQILIGDPMPAVTFTHLDGGSLALQDLDKRPTLLFAWASW